MIKRIFVIALIFVSTTVMAETKPYPDRWEQFETLEDLKDVYWDIYNDTNYEDEAEVLERLKWHEFAFTEEEMDQYRKLNAPEVSAEKSYKLSDQLKTSDILQQYAAYEKKLLRLENDIDLRNWTETVFVNDSLEDSPFDIMEDLHAIEEVLFGKKFEEQKFESPLFIKYDEEQKILLPDSEDWQDGREEALQSMLKNRKYKDRDISLTGMFAGLKKPMDDLLSHSLVRGQPGKKWMEQGTPKTTSGDTYGADVIGYDPPSDDAAAPESETVLIARPWDEQSGTAKQELTAMSELARYSNRNMGQLISNVVQKTEGKNINAEELLKSQLVDWQNGMEFREKKRYHETIKTRLSFWNQNIEAMLEGFISIRRILDAFLKEKIES
jgi:hypothetical protein